MDACANHVHNTYAAAIVVYLHNVRLYNQINTRRHQVWTPLCKNELYMPHVLAPSIQYRVQLNYYQSGYVQNRPVTKMASIYNLNITELWKKYIPISK